MQFKVIYIIEINHGKNTNYVQIYYELICISEFVFNRWSKGLSVIFISKFTDEDLII